LNTRYKHRIASLGLSFFLGCTSLFSQEEEQEKFDPGQIHGAFQFDGQIYYADSLIGATQAREKALMNTFAYFNYTRKNFSAGMRYEAYLNPMQGFLAEYEGQGIANRYAQYTNDFVDVTVGNFYEQFGNGLALRAYWEPMLGVDNSIDGIRVKLNPYKGIYLKGLAGKQRYFWALGAGIVRGADAEINVNEMLDSLMGNMKTKFILGGTFVSKYQDPTDVNLVLPANVGCYGGRVNIIRGAINFNTEYVFKINDPSKDNNYNYRNGQAILSSLNYAKKGLGISLGYKYNDNMSFRSDRNEILTNLPINFLPALTKPHTYNLAATLYPYATQPTGEAAFQGEISYKFKPKTTLGGKYGTSVSANISLAYGLDTTQFSGFDSSRLFYKTNFGMAGFGKDAFFQDINFELRKKINNEFKFVLMYINMFYDYAVVRGEPGHESLTAQIFVVDLNYKINKNHNIRGEFQILTVDKDHEGNLHDQGNWATVLLEYTVSPHWFIAALDQYNYDNPDDTKEIHYPYFTAGYTKGTNRIALGYGKQRAGLFCVGGVCRPVPASNGFTLSITSTF
jgi:hypothetical protein